MYKVSDKLYNIIDDRVSKHMDVFLDYPKNGLTLEHSEVVISLPWKYIKEIRTWRAFIKTGIVDNEDMGITTGMWTATPGDLRHFTNKDGEVSKRNFVVTFRLHK